MADTTARIKMVCPELAELLHKVKGIYELAGGQVNQRSAAGAQSFDQKRAVLSDRMAHMFDLIDLRDGGSLPFKERVALKVEVHREMEAIKKDLGDLYESHSKDLRGRGSKKLSAADLAAREEAFKQLRSELEAIKSKASGVPVARDALAAPEVRIELTEEEFLSSGFGGEGAGGGGGGGGSGSGAGAGAAGGGGAGAFGAGVPREELTEEHRMQMAQIDRVRTEQDERLAEIEARLGEMSEIALNIRDELQYQQGLLEDLDKEIEKSQDKVDRVNKNLDKATKIANDRTTQMCSYLICVIILLGLATVLFNVAKKAIV